MDGLVSCVLGFLSEDFLLSASPSESLRLSTLLADSSAFLFRFFALNKGPSSSESSTMTSSVAVEPADDCNENVDVPAT